MRRREAIRWRKGPMRPRHFVLAAVVALAAVSCSSSDAAEMTSTTPLSEPTTSLSEKAQRIAERKADPDVQAWCALSPEGYVDYEGRGAVYDTFGRYSPGVEADVLAEEYPELLEYERMRLASAPVEVEDALAEAVIAMEAFLVELEAVDWNLMGLDSTHNNALSNNPAWEDLATFEGVYCGRTEGLG